MNVKDYSGYTELTTSAERSAWIERRIRYMKWKKNQGLSYYYKRLMEERATVEPECAHRTSITVLESGQDESARDEAEITYCTDSCKRALNGVLR